MTARLLSFNVPPYALSGAVRIIGEDLQPVPTIHAEVDGTATYSTRVWIDGGVDGTCDCPNAGDGWFCKHQVAVALVWRYRLEGEEPVVDAHFDLLLALGILHLAQNVFLVGFEAVLGPADDEKGPPFAGGNELES